MSVRAVREYQTYENVNSYLTIYPDYAMLYVYHDPVSVQVGGYELRTENSQLPRKRIEVSNVAILDSIRRTRSQIQGIILCNDFDMFATFTFANRRDEPEMCKRRMSNWLRSQQKKYGSFRYLVIPEFHADGKSLHFHAVFGGYNGTVKATKTRGGIKYSFGSFRGGFTNMSYIRSKQRISSYVRKYIQKDMPQFDNRKRYFCSTGLVRPLILRNAEKYIEKDSLEQLYQIEGLTAFKVNEKIPIQLKRSATKWPELVNC